MMAEMKEAPPSPKQTPIEKVLKEADAIFIRNTKDSLPKLMRENLNLILSLGNVISSNSPLEGALSGYHVITLEQPVTKSLAKIGRLTVNTLLPWRADTSVFSKGEAIPCQVINFKDDALVSSIGIGQLRTSMVLTRMEFNATDLCVVFSRKGKEHCIRDTQEIWLKWFGQKLKA